VTSDELLEDNEATSTFVSGRLSLFVQVEIDRQLLRGAGGNEISGVFDRSISTWGRGTTDNNAVAIFKAMNGVRGSAFLEPDAIVSDPRRVAAAGSGAERGDELDERGPTPAVRRLRGLARDQEKPVFEWRGHPRSSKRERAGPEHSLRCQRLFPASASRRAPGRHER
jgi:hypothetical protein